LATASGYDVSMAHPSGDGSTPADIQVLLPRGAFLVECSSGKAASDGQLRGRVEHIVSGRATSFTSPGKLIDFMRGVLMRAQADAAAADANPSTHDPNRSDSRRSTR